MTQKFSVVLADPPWPFRDRGSRAAPAYAGRGRAQAHYETLSLAQIMEAGPFVRAISAEHAFLFLWAPNALVLDGAAQRVACAWGFAPKQLVPWVKTTRSGRPALGMGHYSRVCTEPLLICRRGRARVKARNVPGVIISPRTKHSAKPDASYEWIESLCEGPYLELYARRRYSPRWTAWGKQL